MPVVTPARLDGGPAPFCSFCNQQLFNYGAQYPTAHGTLYCCRKCAIEVLPTIMADAIGQNEIPKKANYVWVQAETHFWKRIAERSSK